MRPSALFPTQRLARWQLALPLLLLALVLLATPATQRLDLWLYDGLITRAPLTPAPELVIVAIDEKSLATLGQWPWPRRVHGDLINRLLQAEARTVTLDILFTEPAPDTTDDRLLARAMERHGNVILPVHLYPTSSTHPLAEFLPTSSLTRAAAALGHVHVELDEDGLARGFYRREGLGQAVWPSLADVTAQRSGRATPPLESTQDADHSPFVNIREGQVRIPFAGISGSIPHVSYVDVLKGEVPPEQLRDRVIFVGATAAGLGDILPTPVSSRAHPMSGVEFHANAYSALVQNRLIKPLPLLPVMALTLLLAGLIIWQFPRLLPGRTLLLSALLAVFPLILSWALLRLFAVWLPPAAPVLLVILAFPIWTGQRVTLLNRFLHRQLDALGQEPRITLSNHHRRSPMQILQQLAELLQPADSWLTVDGRPLHGQRPQVRERDPTGSPNGEWCHRDDLSWVRFYRHGSWHELGFRWREGSATPSLQRFLGELSLHSKEQSPAIRRARERVSRRIDQVRDATEALAGMRRFIGQGLEQMPDGVIVTDGLAVIRFVNSHIADWFDLPQQSLEGMPLVRLVQKTSTERLTDWRSALVHILQGGPPQCLSGQVGERYLLFHLAPFPLPEPGQSGIVANVSDISELREQQRQHRDAIDFISHDVRSPLVSQLALLEQLKNSQEPVPPEALEQAARLARRSYQLAEEFVQLARAEQLTEDRFYDCELLAIVENAADAVDNQAQAKEIQIAVEGDDGIWLKGNAELLERAVINLMTNAIQYSTARTQVTARVARAENLAIVSVTDQGPGIPFEEQSHIFERFRRQRTSEIKGTHGAGLGLTFVRTVADKHQGLVDLTSTPGRGSTFRLYLPLKNS